MGRVREPSVCTTSFAFGMCRIKQVLWGRRRVQIANQYALTETIEHRSRKRKILKYDLSSKRI